MVCNAAESGRDRKQKQEKKQLFLAVCAFPI